jgi:YVTN family beta-propeller protein
LRAFAVAASMAAVACVLPAGAQAAKPALRPVLLVGNNWDGTADVLDVPSYERLRRINIVPDLAERLAENMTPERLPWATFVREQVGEGHDQMVDDLYASKDGRTLYVSRPSFDDVVAIDMASGQIIWRTILTGVRADHMAISPDGTRLVVSTAAAAGAQVVNVLDSATGAMVGTFPSGDSPHENNFSRDGNLIFHASIGRVYTPTDEPALDATKGERVFEIVDAHTLQVLKKWNMGQKLAEAGYPNMSSAVRPMALSPDEKWLYFQVSFFHGFVEFDLQNERVTRVANLPTSASTPANRMDYILDSAHHGIAMNGDGTKLCVAGTVDDYAAIVHRNDFSYVIRPLGARTYWSTSSADGRYCYVSVAGDDTMSIISYASEQEIARVPVGDHPQRARTARVSTAIFGFPPANRKRAKRLTLRAKLAGKRKLRLRGRLVLPKRSKACRGTVRLYVRRGGTIVNVSRTRLRRTRRACVYSRKLRLSREAAKPGRLVANARFVGNDSLLPERAKPRSVRIGSSRP